MLKTKHLFFLLVLIGAFAGCRGRSPFNEENKVRYLFTPDPTDVNKTYKEWRRSFEEEASTGRTDRQLFRKVNFQFPASSQFRQTLAFSSEGSETTGKLLISKQLRNGAAALYSGTWEFTDATQTLTLRYLDKEVKQSVTESYQVITLVQDMLLLQAR